MRHTPQPTSRPDSASQHPARELLRDAFANASAAATPDFRTAVWARIHARISPPTWWQWLRSHAAAVSAAAAICVIAAAVSASVIAYHQNRSQREQQLQRYLASIDAHRLLAEQSNSQPPALRQ